MQKQDNIQKLVMSLIISGFGWFLDLRCFLKTPCRAGRLLTRFGQGGCFGGTIFLGQGQGDQNWYHFTVATLTWGTWGNNLSQFVVHTYSDL